MYTAASAVYDWFDLTTLPLDMEDARTEGDLTYYRVDAENLSLPVSTVAELTDSALPWQPQPASSVMVRRRSAPKRLMGSASFRSFLKHHITFHRRIHDDLVTNDCNPEREFL